VGGGGEGGPGEKKEKIDCCEGCKKKNFFPMLSISRTALPCLKVPSFHPRIILIPAVRFRVALSATSSHGLARDRTRFSTAKDRKSQGTAYLVFEVYLHYIA
jgi:hypothetical protein